MASYSKAPWGLSVLVWVIRIFTDNPISPGLSSRQRSDRYSIRAGRNLPDKEFRYLRTVIVTAAVHRGFDSVLAHPLLTFRHWAGVSPYTSPYGFAETCVFVKQSPEPLHCNHFELHTAWVLTLMWHLFSRSYEAILPSSLTRVIPRILGFSPCPPVSVYGTVTQFLARGFSWQRGISKFAPVGAPHHTSGLPERICLSGLPTCLDQHFRSLARLASCVPPLLITILGGTGISTCYPSLTLLSLSLGPTNPGRTNLPQETLGFRCIGFSPMFSLLMPTFSLLLRPPVLTIWLQPTTERSPTDHPLGTIPRLRCTA